jgi:hypothetical protein
MTSTTTKWDELDRQWAELAVELGADPSGTGPALSWSHKQTVTLDVVGAKLIQPDVLEDPDDKGIVVLRVRAKTGRVIELEMELPIDSVIDARHDYDLVDGELVKHEYDLSKPEEVARYFGLKEVAM